MKERHADVIDIGLGHAHVLDLPEAREMELRMRHQDALGGAGRARRVENRADVLVTHLPAGRSVAALQQRVKLSLPEFRRVGVGRLAGSPDDD